MVKKKQGKSSGTLLLDIGSASVGAAVLHSEKNNLHLEKMRRKPLTVGSEEARKDLETRMLTALDELLKEYTEQYREVRVTLAAPWHDAHIRMIRTHSEKPKTISESGIGKLIEKYKNEKPPKSGQVDVEATALQVLVNNYPTALTQEVLGTELAINFYESEMSQALHKTLTDKIHAAFPNARLSFHTFPLIAATALRGISFESSFIVIDVGGEVSEVAVLYKDGIQFLGSIPHGYWTLARGVNSESVGDARSRLTLWLKGELSPDEAQAVSQKFQEAFAPWREAYESLLKEAGTVVPLPRSVYLLSDTEPLEWYSKGIELIDSLNQTPLTVTPMTVQSYIQIGQGGTFDTFLSLAALFFHTGEREVIGEPELRKVV